MNQKGGLVMVKKKLKLEVSLTSEFRVMGLFTTQKDYRLCWLLNQHLQLDLKRLPDFEYTPLNQSVPGRFAIYHCHVPELRMRYFLVCNKCSKGVLFGEPKNLDYLLLLKQPGDQWQPKELINSIREMPAMQAVYSLDGKLGNRGDAFLYDFEMYLGEALK